MAVAGGDDALLRAVIDRIIPRDDDPGALDLGSLDFVLQRLAEGTEDADIVARGLEALETAAAALGRPFATLAPREQVPLLEAVEHEPWFVRLVTLTAEGFYADPDNGGNDGARSWKMIGYRHGLPDRPSGPPKRTP
jgi:hypothetical protein